LHLARRRSRLRPLGDADFGTMVKKARKAGIKGWKAVHPHALRKSFEEGVKRRPDGTMMGEKDQEFLIGHILLGLRTPARIGRQRPGLDDKLQQLLDRR
jgi:hypothetical protein